MSAPLELIAADGYRLAADLYQGTGRGGVLIAPAMGVRRGFYAGLAEHLARSGPTVLVLDYRGMGGSRPAELRGFGARLRDWAELDLEAALAALQARAESVVWMGHSVGGQLFGLIQRPQVRAALFVASQSGHWRNWDGAPRWLMAGVWHLIPGLTRATGRLPMAAAGQGEDVPPGVAEEWAAWGRHPDYIMSYARGLSGCAFSEYAGPIRSYAISDDGYAPPRSVQALLGFYARARTELVRCEPGQLGLAQLGHFGPFRRAALPLWEEWRQWIHAALA